MKESKFNIYLKSHDGVKLAFNSLSCGLAIVDNLYEELISQLPQLSSDNIPQSDLKDVFEKAKLGKFIVEDDVDELSEFLVQRNLQKYNTKLLGLTIAPTLNCNFKCVYCYENANNGVMSKQTEESIINFVKKQSSQLNRFSVSWYGGEPLLSFKNIEHLSEEFLKICDENKIKYNASMVSNGSLLTDEIISEMEKYKINRIQITVDGTKEIHDARRVSKNGKSCFDTIIANIGKLLDSEIKVTLRINVDKTNEENLEEFLEFLKGKFSGKGLTISFGRVTAYTEVCKSIEDDCFGNDEFANRQMKYYGLIEKYGLKNGNPYPYPKKRLNYCCAELLNSFVIDNEGYIYKCWNEVGIVKNSIGNINDKTLNLSNIAQSKWILRDILKNEKCRNCQILPLCLGGCPHITNVKKQDNVCDLIKFNLQDILLKYYEYSRR